MTELLSREQQYLDENFNSNMMYNISRYSSGGDLLSNHPRRQEIINKNKENLKLIVRKPASSFRDKNPNWRGGKTFYTCAVCGNEKRKSGIGKYQICVKCRDRNGEKNPFYGKYHTDETKSALRQKATSRGNRISRLQSILVEIDGIIYPSFSEAARSIKCAVATIRNRINNSNKFPSYKLVNQVATGI